MYEKIKIKTNQRVRPKKSAMSWVVETSGDATCMKDYISMNAPVVDLLSAEDLTLALHYLDPTLSNPDAKSLYKKGELNSRPVKVRLLAVE